MFTLFECYLGHYICLLKGSSKVRVLSIMKNTCSKTRLCNTNTIPNIRILFVPCSSTELQ